MSRWFSSSSARRRAVVACRKSTGMSVTPRSRGESRSEGWLDERQQRGLGRGALDGRPVLPGAGARHTARKSAEQGWQGAVSVDLGGRGITKKINDRINK